MPLIQMTGVTKEYGTKQKVAALRGVDFTANSHDFVAIMGKSGSGKSTILNILAGIDGFDKGSYLFENTDMKNLQDDKMTDFRRRNIGFIVQHFALIHDYNVFDNIALPLHYERVSRSETGSRVKDMANRLGISDKLKKYPDELSGGQAQRVAIARAIINTPKVLLADEPTGALDEATGDEIINLFDELNGSGVTIVLVTHDVKIAQRCKRVVHIRDGFTVNEEGGFRDEKV
jgi:putative ABC transport system ATP-binding protein